MESEELPYGYTRNKFGEVEPHPAEQRVLAACRQLRACGWTVEQIAQALSERGLLYRGSV